MILDLDGGAVQRTMSPRLGWMLSVASAAVATAALLIMSAIPHEAPSRPLASGPSILEQALARPTPRRLDLVLPADVAAPLSQVGTQDGTGNARSAITPRSFRLRVSNDVVSVAPIPNAPPIAPPAERPADALAVHGNYAQWWITEPTSVSVLRWTENGTTYEISSRTLRPKDLARLADLLH